MILEKLAKRYPRLYHVTTPGAWLNIKKHGLWSTSHILDQFGIKGIQRTLIETKRRTSEIALEHPLYGYIVINDNLPLNEQILKNCLNDGLAPEDWLCMLNTRVFFWPNKEKLERLLAARGNKNRLREVIVVDTLSLLKKHAKRIELSPINSGSTIRKAARRGLNTFIPLIQNDGRNFFEHHSQVCEIVVRDYIHDISEHTVEVFLTKNKDANLNNLK